jgi:hypothetical protein
MADADGFGRPTLKAKCLPTARCNATLGAVRSLVLRATAGDGENGVWQMGDPHPSRGVGVVPAIPWLKVCPASKVAPLFTRLFSYLPSKMSIS